MRFDRDLDIKYNKYNRNIKKIALAFLGFISDTVGLLSLYAAESSLELVIKSSPTPYTHSINSENHTPVDRSKAGNDNENL